MRKLLPYFFLFFCLNVNSQSLKFQTLLKDSLAIRAVEIWKNKIWYAGTNSKFGYVSLNDSTKKKQISLSANHLQFRTIAQDKESFYCINIESPAYFFKIYKKTLDHQVLYVDTLKTAFYDALHFVNNDLGYALSDPDQAGHMRLAVINKKGKNKWYNIDFGSAYKFHNGEAAFAASNTNIASSEKYMWIATGGSYSRICRLEFKKEEFSIFETPFIQGKSSQGIYSIDFYDDSFGVAVGGDYTKQNENLDNIATTNDGGKSWQIQASGKNSGYKTCVKIRPGSQGKDIIAVGDQNIEYSEDYGKSWKKISDEKNLYTCLWVNKDTLVFAGKGRIMKATFIK